MVYADSRAASPSERGRSHFKDWMFHVKRNFRNSQAVDKIAAQSSAWGFEMSADHVSLLVDFCSLLDSYEESNVIGAKTFDAIVADHVLDSMSCVLFKSLKDAESLVDVGSGGGLPGIPLGIAMEDLRTTLIEATAKKVKFLNGAVSQLGRPNMQIVNARAEDAGNSPEFRGRYDVATARALAPLDVLAEYCLPLVRVGGHVIAMKGRIEKEEIDRGKVAGKSLGAEIMDVIPVSRLPEYEQKQRHLVVFEKIARTPAKYPRRVGLPAKNPLGEVGNR